VGNVRSSPAVFEDFGNFGGTQSLMLEIRTHVTCDWQTTDRFCSSDEGHEEEWKNVDPL